MILTRVTDAASEALSLIDAKAHLRMTESEDNDVLELIITAVRHAVEEHLERTLVTSKWKLELDSFPALDSANPFADIQLPMRPIQSIETVQYYDSDNAQQTVGAANYEFDSEGRLRPASGFEWPSTFARINAVEINYTAGDISLGKLPEDLRLALRLLVGHYEQNREGSAFSQVLTIPDGYKFLLNPHRIHRA